MELRRLTPQDEPLHRAMTAVIVEHLPSPEMLIPMTDEEYGETFREGSEDVVYGLFEGGRMIATSSMLHNVADYATEPEMEDILKHRCVEIGECMVLPEHRGKGLMLKLNELILQTARREGIEYILATAHPDNKASNTSLQHLGLHLVKVFDRHGFVRNLRVMKCVAEDE